MASVVFNASNLSFISCFSLRRSVLVCSDAQLVHLSQNPNGERVNEEEIIKELESLRNPEALKGMQKYGINTQKAYGVQIPDLRKLAKRIGKNHELSKKLWKKGIRETKILASMIADPNLVGEEQMEAWVKDFDSWEVCDQCCMNLFEKTKYAYKKSIEWSSRKEEFVKRAGFVLMARLAVSDKKAPDEEFEQFFPIIKEGAKDERNFVKKAVNWALRQIGKRNRNLNEKAISVAETLLKSESDVARWVARDALRELKSENVQKRLS